MSKELEALKQVNELIKNVEEYKNKKGIDNPTISMSEKLLISIQNALQRLEAIDNANPSEALEDLKELHKLAYGNDKTSWKIDNIRMSLHIKQALIKAQEQEKENAELKSRIQDLEKDLEVLEILRNKPFILQKIFENKGLEPNAQKDYDGDYFWGTIDEEEYQKVKMWLEENVKDKSE